MSRPRRSVAALALADPLWMGLDRPGLHEHRGESGSVQGRLGDGHLLGGCPVHAEAALCARRDTSGRGADPGPRRGRMIGSADR